MVATPHPLLLLSNRPWNEGLADRLRVALKRPLHTIGNPAELELEAVAALDPEWIFVPHWSQLIPEAIWCRWPTVIFHMTHLPYGRGGSPLQNLIQRGHSSTMLTALRCSAELDAGPIYLKDLLILQGSAEEIFLRADALIEAMIAPGSCERSPSRSPSRVNRCCSASARPSRATSRSVDRGICSPGTTRSACWMPRDIPMDSWRPTAGAWSSAA
jgi:hypothetical protein